MKTLKYFILALAVVTYSLTTFATAKPEPTSGRQDDYYASYYEEEGNLLFKIRAFYTITESKIKNLPAATNTGKAAPKNLAQNGYGVESAMTIFATDNIAAEISIGLGFYKTRSATLLNTFAAYGSGTTPSPGKRNEIITVPVTVTGQYHIAPFGGIRPYVGAGYNGTYMHTRSKAMKVQNAHGPVLQAGFDFIAKDDTLITLDIKQYFIKSKVTFKQGFLNTANDISSKVTWNPTVISAGIGFKF